MNTNGFISPSTLTILGTYQCTAQCEDCCFGSNPWITKRIELNHIISTIDQAARIPTLKLVVFSGGECFLLGKDLVKAVAYATSKNLKTRCVTNGYWAKSIEHGRHRLQELRENGLSELNISTGDMHVKFVPIDSVINAARLAIELELESVLIVIESRKNAKITKTTIINHPKYKDYLEYFNGRLRIVESPWMPMDINRSIEQDNYSYITSENVHLRKGCKSILKTIVLTPDKKIGLCCGLSRELLPELNIKSLNIDLSKILEDAGKDFIKIWLFVEGPERILAWAASKNPNIEWEGRYAHHCHACLAIFQNQLVRDTIKSHYHEKVDEVLFKYSVMLKQQEYYEGVVYG